MGIYTSAQIIYGFPYDVEDLGLEDDQYDENYNLLHHHGYDTYPEMIGVCVEDREMGRPGNPLSLDAFTCSPSEPSTSG